MSRHLHIVCLNVPYPVDYGGVYDLFYKLPALQQLGIQIHLHCFDYGRGEQKELEKYCASVQYYKRLKKLSLSLPYIVSSRKNEVLLSNLLKDDYPVLLEGVHCSYPLLDKRFNNRRLFVRLHNVEFEYYRHLYKYTAHPLKKLYYFTESILLKQYECRIANKANAFWAVANTDVQLYQQHFKCKAITYLPLFLPPWQIACKEGSGTYCLYHGNLAVEENEKAAVWLLQHVFAKLSMPFIIAGKNPTKRLIKLAALNKNVKIIANASQSEMEKLIADAHIHILPSFNATGIKIKLLNALYNGRHCVVNTAIAAGTNLESLCHIADSPEAIQQMVQQLSHIPFTQPDIQQRKQLLQHEFNNLESAKKIAAQL